MPINFSVLAPTHYKVEFLLDLCSVFGSRCKILQTVYAFFFFLAECLDYRKVQHEVFFAIKSQRKT